MAAGNKIRRLRGMVKNDAELLVAQWLQNQGDLVRQRTTGITPILPVSRHKLLDHSAKRIRVKLLAGDFDPLFVRVGIFSWKWQIRFASVCVITGTSYLTVLLNTTPAFDGLPAT